MPFVLKNPQNTSIPFNPQTSFSQNPLLKTLQNTFKTQMLETLKTPRVLETQLKKKTKKTTTKKAKKPWLKDPKTRPAHEESSIYHKHSGNDQINQKRRLPRPEADPSHVFDSEISTDNNENKSKKA